MDKSCKKSQSKGVLEQKARITRRAFIAGSALSVLAGAASYSTLSATTSELQVKKVLVPIPNLPNAFDGFTIGIISDIHFSPVVGESIVEEAGDLLNQNKIDLLVLGGDYVWAADSPVERAIFNQYSSYFGIEGIRSSHDYAFQLMVRLSERIKSTLGGVAVYGNHDRRFLPKACENAFKESKSVTLLRNESRTFKFKSSNLEVIGVDDFVTGIPRYDGITVPPASDTLRLLVSHNPDFFVSKEGQGFYHLGLSGHTHGGQIKLPVIGAPTYNIRFSNYREGLYLEPHNLIYVTKGIGMVGLPFRINCPPEVSILTLTSQI